VLDVPAMMKRIDETELENVTGGWGMLARGAAAGLRALNGGQPLFPNWFAARQQRMGGGGGCAGGNCGG
jgi:bacteriocin-like protein